MGRGPLFATEDALQRIVAEARDEWPQLVVEPECFLAYLAERVPPSELATPRPPHLLRAGDLWLACACLHRVPGALAAFDRACLAGCPTYLQRIDPSAAFADEVAQIVREKLFVADGDRPARISEYAGRGSLASWVRVTVMRTALNLRRARTVVLAAGDADLDVAVEGDAALAFARKNYRAPFEAAVRAAVAGLTARERTVLRFHYVDGLSLDKIAMLYKVHRSSVARWLADTRDALHATIRNELRQRLGVAGSECESMATALYSQLTLSLGSLLQSPPPA